MGTFFLGGLRFPFVSPGLLIPAQLGRVAKTGCIFVIADSALGRIWVWMVCCICLASNPALVAYEIVLSGSAYCRLHSSFSRSCLFFVFFSSIFFIYVVAPGLFLPKIPRGLPFGEIQLTNYAFSHDMICNNLDPLLVSLFLLFLFRVVRRICGLGWVGLENGATEGGGESLISLCMVGWIF